MPGIPLIGYADRLSARAGERIAFKVSSRLGEDYSAELVRIVCGDPNPEGPGLVERPVPAAFAGRYRSRPQEIRGGSFALLDDLSMLPAQDRLTLGATVWPTAPGRGAEPVLTLLGAGGARLALGISADGRPAAWTDGDAPAVAADRPVAARRWLRLEAAFDLAAGSVALTVRPIGRDERAEMRTATLGSRGPIAPRRLLVGSFDGVTGRLNGKVESPALSAAAGERPLVALDFSRGIPSQRVEDTGPHALAGRLVNLPTRGVTGSAWTGEETCWRHAPAHYAAIHFHDDDLGDCGWETDFAFDVPEDLPSGLYAAKLTGGGAVDRIPFVVPPPKGRRHADLCVVIPTFTYLIYGNHARIDVTDALRRRMAEWRACPWNAVDHPELGLSTYNFHSDGSGIAIASPLRPLLTLRPDYLSIHDPRGSGLRHLPADTHLLAWLDARGIACDLVTDHELHAEGATVLDGYRAVLTTTHPEYHTAETLDALAAYRDGGGHLGYLGGNGFYWRVAMQREAPGALEIRRAEGGIRAWEARPGEYWNAFDGTYGGLWRRNARPPQALVGVGFSAQGLFEGAPYRRTAASHEPGFAWLFEGIEDDVIGAGGLSGGGAAGFELDRADPALGTPPEATILASSFGHGRHFTPVFEELLNHVTTVTGEPRDALVRADMIYWPTKAGGAVFSAGSITFCGSLVADGFQNDISRLLLNLLSRWLGDGGPQRPAGDRPDRLPG